VPLSPAARSAVGGSHPLAWFDAVFRSPLGPALPFALLLARGALGLGAGAGAGGAPFAGAGLPSVPRAAAVYATAYAVRLAVYAAHSRGLLLRLLARLAGPRTLAALFPGAPGGDPHVMSDHLLLASSVGAQLLVEGVACLEGALWLGRGGGGGGGGLGVGLGGGAGGGGGAGAGGGRGGRRAGLLALSALALGAWALTLANSWTTVRYMHGVMESVTAFMFGWAFWYVVPRVTL